MTHEDTASIVSNVMDAEAFSQLVASHIAVSEIAEVRSAASLSSSSSSSSSDSDDEVVAEVKRHLSVKKPLNKPPEPRMVSSNVATSLKENPPSSAKSKESVKVTLLLQQSLRLGFIPNVIYKKEVQRAGKRQSTLDIKRSNDSDTF